MNYGSEEEYMHDMGRYAEDEIQNIQDANYADHVAKENAPTESKEVSGESYYPGQQFQRLLNVINESSPNPTITQMQDIIHVVHKDFPKEEGQDAGVEERILCAANYYQDGIVHGAQPKNISNGFITCGRRHHNCIGTFALIVGFPYNEKAHEIHRTEVQGFLTSTNLFVDRKEAYRIAFNANQIKGPNKGQQENSIGLTSEDLY